MMDHDTPEVRSTRQARQGIELHAIRYVLAGGIVGAVLGLLIAWSVLA